jgi:hypothetical protein
VHGRKFMIGRPMLDQKAEGRSSAFQICSTDEDIMTTFFSMQEKLLGDSVAVEQQSKVPKCGPWR